MRIIKKLLIWLSGLSLAAFFCLYLAFTLALLAPPPDPAPASDKTDYYLAYGSNMSPQYLSRIRGVSIQWSAAASLSGHAIRFTLPGPNFIEPSYAVLSPAVGETAYGVVHRVSDVDLRHIKGSENTAYAWQQVKVSATQSGETITAWTLISPQNEDIEVPPSRRYYKIMHSAAVLFNFPESVVEWLDPEHGAYTPILSEAIGTYAYCYVWVRTRFK
jgi:hypothetical protein